jgi:hypothetical protein
MRGPRTGFAYLALGQAQIMLEEIGAEVWQTGPLEAPLGRGMHLQIEVEDLTLLEARLTAAGWPLFRAPETAWYRDGAIEHGQRQLLVQDPDGYLSALHAALGRKARGGLSYGSGACHQIRSNEFSNFLRRKLRQGGRFRPA